MSYTLGESWLLFCHSPEIWVQMWNGLVFDMGVVKVRTKLLYVERKDFERDEGSSLSLRLLSWSVTRL
jgi:hypothetical protein